jgi:hypothetical protein
MKKQIAFIDECGNNGLDFYKTGVSSHFIVTAILFDEDILSAEEKKIEIIRQTHFQTGEMKSSNVADNDNRRIKILRDLDSINYHIFSIVIDKRKLITEGFKYKQSFYKFLHSLVDRELFKIFPQIRIVSDEHGGENFKAGFVSYIRNKHISDLFNQDFVLSNSKSELAVQLADFISGTLGRCYEETKLSESKSTFLEILKSKITVIKFWPNEYSHFSFIPDGENEYDETIANLGISLAEQFVKEYEQSGVPAEIDQVNCAKYILFYFKNINPSKYVSTLELIGNIESIKGTKVSIHYFRSKVIAKLRDKGILLSSSSKGYKLPSSAKDLFDFVNHSNSYIQPMIDRIIKCRNLIKSATKNNIDILDYEEFKYLFQIKNNLP